MRALQTVFASILFASCIGVFGFAIFVSLQPDVEDEHHRSIPLEFASPFQPDAVGPVRVRFDCPERPGQGPVTVKVLYAGHPNEAGRRYANETFEILLDAVYASGRQGEVVEVPAKAMDRRVRALVDQPFGADVTVAGQGGLFGTRYVLSGAEIPEVIEVRCWPDRLE